MTLYPARCTAGPFNTNAPKEKDRYDELDDILSTTGQAFLGLMLGCARCHDHKYDPISQLEYYRLSAAFTSSRRAQRPIWIAADYAAAEDARQQKIAELPLDADERRLLPAKFASCRNTKDDGPATWRRSIYLFRKRSVPIPMLQAFDAPDGNNSSGKRPQTTVVPQALTLMNDPTLRKHVERFADRVLAEAGVKDRTAQVRLAYRIALARQPRPDELVAVLEFLD